MINDPGNLISQIEVKSVDHAQHIVKISLANYFGDISMPYQCVTKEIVIISEDGRSEAGGLGAARIIPAGCVETTPVVLLGLTGGRHSINRAS